MARRAVPESVDPKPEKLSLKPAEFCYNISTAGALATGSEVLKWFVMLCNTQKFADMFGKRSEFLMKGQSDSPFCEQIPAVDNLQRD